jgi:hypothetical protein
VLRRATPLFVLAAAGAIAVSGCGSSSSSPAGSTSPSTSASGGSHPSSQAPVVGSVTMVNGKPQGGVKRISLKAGQPAALIVTSNKPAQVHVHGADRLVPVPANMPTSVDVSEAASGSYEVEDHASDALLVQLRVS